MKSFSFISQFLLIFMLAAILPPQPALAGEVNEANYGREGQVIDPKSLMVPGRPVVIDLNSLYCPPCRLLSSRLEKLARKDSYSPHEGQHQPSRGSGDRLAVSSGTAVWAENSAVSRAS